MFTRSLYVIGKNHRNLSLNTRPFHNLAKFESCLPRNLTKKLTFMTSNTKGILVSHQQFISPFFNGLRTYSSSTVHFAPRFRLTPTTVTRPKPLVDEESELANL